MNGRRQPQRLELIDLILHQRDQRRDNQREAVLHDRRKLIAKTLAAAGGHHAQTVFAGEDCLDHFPLTGPKARQSEAREKSVECQHRPQMA